MSRQPSTGKYKTRAELIQSIHFFYYHTNQNQAQVARTTGVSETTIASILKTKKKL